MFYLVVFLKEYIGTSSVLLMCIAWNIAGNEDGRKNGNGNERLPLPHSFKGTCADHPDWPLSLHARRDQNAHKTCRSTSRRGHRWGPEKHHARSCQGKTNLNMCIFFLAYNKTLLKLFNFCNYLKDPSSNSASGKETNAAFVYTVLMKYSIVLPHSVMFQTCHTTFWNVI